MHNPRWMFLGWTSAAVLAVAGWMAYAPPATDPLAPAAWTGPEAEPAPVWPQLVLPLLLLGGGALAHARWRERQHQRDRRSLEQDMREGLESQNQLLTLAGLLPVGISHVEEDAEGQLLARYVNPRMAELLGVRLDDLQFDAKAGWRHVHPDDLRQANMALSQAAASVRRGVPLVEVETLCRVQRGEHTRWLRTSSQVRRAEGEAGRLGVVDIHACTEDITQARRQHKFSQDVLDGYPAPVRIRDLAGRHLLTNPAFDRLHLLRPGESVGKTDAELLPLDVQRLYRAVDDQLVASGQTQVFEQTLADTSGPRTHQVTQFLLRDEDQRPYATCAISTDVSSLQAAQSRLQRLLDAVPVPALISCGGSVVYANRRCEALLDVKIGACAAGLYVDPSDMKRLEHTVGEGHTVTEALRLWAPGRVEQSLRVTAVPTDHNGQRAVLTWLEATALDASGRRSSHLRAVHRAA